MTADMHYPDLPLSDRHARLDTLLDELAWLWRPQPYKTARPPWCGRLPALTDTLLGLSEAALLALEDDNTALLEMIAAHVPSAAGLAELNRFPDRTAAALAGIGPQMVWAIPGRKWTQITAFARALGPVRGPLLEWCGGKGHLGRLLAAQGAAPVLTVERDPRLCEEGVVLARRARVTQDFQVVDVMSPAAMELIGGHHVVALHACGELHRQLLRDAVTAGVAALDVAPCCYAVGAAAVYQPLSPTARLMLTRDDLRLAVTETVTSQPRVVALRDREMAWKLGFDLLRRKVTGHDEYLSINPIDKNWLALDFVEFCRRLAAREGVAVPAAVAWDAYEGHGWRRQRETRRLSLARHAFRRSLEVWLVLDMADYLVARGYAVDVGTFCPRQVTPRNILLSARRPEPLSRSAVPAG
ncbi:MAG: methyltransferase [Pseudomonadota bacterium]